MVNLHGRPDMARVSRSLTRRLQALAAEYGDKEALADLGEAAIRH
jgi:hypothetical protein